MWLSSVLGLLVSGGDMLWNFVVPLEDRSAERKGEGKVYGEGNF
jgi:hypothetical protein